jgi:hypothetical protein
VWGGADPSSLARWSPRERRPGGWAGEEQLFGVLEPGRPEVGTAVGSLVGRVVGEGDGVGR